MLMESTYVENFSVITEMFQYIYLPNPNKHIEVFKCAPKEYQPHLIKAFELAEKEHAGQIRKGSLGRPYTDHLLMVWFITFLLGGNLDQQLAAILHDLIEDCQNSKPKRHSLICSITKKFGLRVVTYVMALSTDMGGNSKLKEIELVSAMIMTEKLIKSADNFCNFWDLLHDTPDYEPEWIEYAMTFRIKVLQACDVCKGWLYDVFWLLIEKWENSDEPETI
jgi:(p)ppGpp synthase/HD superfamily hydrolase